MQKLFILSLIIFLVSGSVLAKQQTKEQIRKPGSQSTPSIEQELTRYIESAYVDVNTAHTMIKDKYVLFSGLSVGFYLKSNIILGCSFDYLTYPRKRTNFSDVELAKDDPGYVGEQSYSAVLGYNIIRSKKFGVNLITNIGGGHFSLFDDGLKTDNNYFFNLEPAVSLRYRLYKYVWLSFGVSYKYTNGIKSEEFTDRDFMAPRLNVGFYMSDI